MLTIRCLRMFFLALAIVCGYYIGTLFFLNVNQNADVIGAGIGGMLALILMILEIRLRNVSLRNLSAGVFGLVFGFFTAWLLTLILRLVPMDEVYYSSFQIVFTLTFCYLGMVISIKGKDDFNLIIPYVRFSPQEQGAQIYLIDTNVIIDGRITGICESGFITGKLLVPRFVLQELQQIADSSDDAKRPRGRRGLDILSALRKINGVEVIIHDEELSEIHEVDSKLVRLAKMVSCRIITNDYNLNKVAKIEGVSVLNINDLANSLRHVVSPGEEMHVQIRKEGREKNQGVAFLDDGTMIVVDNARRFVGQGINVTVTSVLQTSAGRMIFANLIQKNGDSGNAVKGQNGKSQATREKNGSRQRRPQRRDRSKRQAKGLSSNDPSSNENTVQEN